MTSAGGYGSIQSGGGYGSAPICRFFLIVPLYRVLSTVVPVPVAGPSMQSAGGYGSIPPSGGYGSAPICRFLLYHYIMFSLQSSQCQWQDHP